MVDWNKECRAEQDRIDRIFQDRAEATRRNIEDLTIASLTGLRAHDALIADWIADRRRRKSIAFGLFYWGPNKWDVYTGIHRINLTVWADKRWTADQSGRHSDAEYIARFGRDHSGLFCKLGQVPDSASYLVASLAQVVDD